MEGVVRRHVIFDCLPHLFLLLFDLLNQSKQFSRTPTDSARTKHYPPELDAIAHAASGIDTKIRYVLPQMGTSAD